MSARTLAILSLLLTLALVLPAMAAKPKPQQNVFTDPAQAGPDYAVQGEYLGKFEKSDSSSISAGMQVIALGKGQFEAVGYEGGLPGAGWKKTEKLKVAGETKDGVTTLRAKGENVTVTIRDDVLTVVEGGKTRGTLKKVHRESPTLGAKPPAGAVVLFDGSTADNFVGGRKTDDGLLAEGDTSKQKFGSFTIHLEFRTPFMPDARGQGRGNSGFYAQGRYEVQILDSFGLEGVSDECGGIYKVAKPAVNMCLPPLAWQTYDVDFTAAEYKDGKKVKNARMTVRHNGVEIHKDVEVPHTTTAAPVHEGPEPGPIYLQNHGNPVRFRNIWVVEKK